MAAERLSWLARNGRTGVPARLERGVASPGEESLTAAIAARRSRRSRPVARSRHQEAARVARQTASQGEDVADMVRARGQVQRAKEQKRWRTERRSQLSGTRPSARIADTGVCRLRISVPLDRSVAGAALFTVRLTIGIRRTPNRGYDEARPQLSLAADAAGNGNLEPAPSPGLISGGTERPCAPMTCLPYQNRTI